MQTDEAWSFPEAVERLAGQAGLEMPRQSNRRRRCERAKRALDPARRVGGRPADWFEELSLPEPGGARRA